MNMVTLNQRLPGINIYWYDSEKTMTDIKLWKKERKNKKEKSSNIAVKYINRVGQNININGTEYKHK